MPVKILNQRQGSALKYLQGGISPLHAGDPALLFDTSGVSKSSLNSAWKLSVDVLYVQLSMAFSFLILVFRQQVKF